jgi:hypothetical protein
MTGRVSTVLGVLLLVALLVGGLYLWVVLSWPYSEGELAISIVPGVTPVIWSFSVRDEGLPPQINAALGKRVVLHYREHRGLPTNCFGETSYFVTGVRVME